MVQNDRILQNGGSVSWFFCYLCATTTYLAHLRWVRGHHTRRPTSASSFYRGRQFFGCTDDMFRLLVCRKGHYHDAFLVVCVAKVLAKIYRYKFRTTLSLTGFIRPTQILTTHNRAFTYSMGSTTHIWLYLMLETRFTYCALSEVYV